MTRPGRWILAAALCCGCSAPGETADDDDVGVNRNAILNGTLLNPVDSGVPQLTRASTAVSSTCSGTLLTNRWVLTAAHCVPVHLDHAFASEGQYLDRSFGSTVNAAKADSSGRLVIAGTLDGKLYLSRLTVSGTPDTTFNSTGKLTFDVPWSTDESIEEIALQSNGRIVAAGWATVNNQPVMMLARFNTNGSLDTTYNSAGAGGASPGTVNIDFTTSSRDLAYGVAIDSSGRAVVAGVALQNSSGKFALARCSANGTLDTSFGSAGKVITDMGSTVVGQANDVTIDSSGRIVAAGITLDGGGNTGATIARYDSAGTLDTSFGPGGFTRFPSSSRPSFATVVRTQGNRILVGGSYGNDATVWRYTETGALDRSFGDFLFGTTLGYARLVLRGQPIARVVGLALSSDGRIRLGVDTQIAGTATRQPAYGAMSADGVTSRIDRIFTETLGGMLLPWGDNTLAFNVTITTSAFAVSGTQVFVVGTGPFLGASPIVLALQPDRLVDTVVDFNYGAKASMDLSDGPVLADQVWVPPSVVGEGGDDVALVHLQSGLRMNGTMTDYRFPGFWSNADALLNQTVTCRGYGNSVINPDGTQSGGGDLRTGTSLVTSVQDPYIGLGFVPNATPQVPLRGDSGAGCTIAPNNLLVGVDSVGNNDTSFLIKASRFMDWADQRIARPEGVAPELGYHPGFLPQAVKVSGSTVYWATSPNALGAGIASCRTTGCVNVPVDLTNGAGSPTGLVLDATRMYWPDLALGVVSCPLTGCVGSPTVLAATGGSSGGIVKDASNLYWTEVNAGRIRACAVTGCAGSGTELAVSSSIPTAIAINGSNLFWLEISSSGNPTPANGRVMRCSTSCAHNATAFATGQRLSIESAYNNNALAVAGGRVFWIANTGQSAPVSRIMSCPTTGCSSGGTAFADVNDQFVGLYSDGTNVYWGSRDASGPAVMRRRVDASAPAQRVVSAGGTVTALTSDATYVYWTETPAAGSGPNYLMRAPK